MSCYFERIALSVEILAGLQMLVGVVGSVGYLCNLPAFYAWGFPPEFGIALPSCTMLVSNGVAILLLVRLAHHASIPPR